MGGEGSSPADRIKSFEKLSAAHAIWRTVLSSGSAPCLWKDARQHDGLRRPVNATVLALAARPPELKVISKVLPPARPIRLNKNDRGEEALRKAPAALDAVANEQSWLAKVG